MSWDVMIICSIHHLIHDLIHYSAYLTRITYLITLFDHFILSISFFLSLHPLF